MSVKKPADKKPARAPAPAPIPELEPIEPARTRVAVDIEISYERLTSDPVAAPLEDVADDLQSEIVEVARNVVRGDLIGTFRVLVIRSTETPA